MGLKWKNNYGIAQALNEKYGNTVDVMNLDAQELIKMVITLDDWSDAPIPTDIELCHDVIHAWIDITNETN